MDLDTTLMRYRVGICEGDKYALRNCRRHKGVLTDDSEVASRRWMARYRVPRTRERGRR